MITKAAAINPALTQFPGPWGYGPRSMALTTPWSSPGRILLAPDIPAHVRHQKPQDDQDPGLHLPAGRPVRESASHFSGPGRANSVSQPEKRRPGVSHDDERPSAAAFAIVILLASSRHQSTVSGMVLSITSILVRDVWVRFFDSEAATEAGSIRQPPMVVLTVAGALAFVFWGPRLWWVF